MGVCGAYDAANQAASVTTPLPPSFKSQPAAPQAALRHISLAIDAAKNAAQSEKNRKTTQAALAEDLAIAEGMALAKNLANAPGNVCTPAYLADAALQLADK